MDISKEYIRQCDCPEIQENWVIQKPDAVIERREHGDFEKVAYWLLTDEEQSEVIENPKNYIFLPRQDQIQEIIFTEFKRTFEGPTIFLVNNFFFHWLYNESSGHMRVKAKTLEQLWLAFYMYEKHGKVWDGNGWVQEKT